MNILEFLTRIETSLNLVEVKGKENLGYILGCLMAIDEAKQSILNGGEDNGRQSDTGLDSGSGDADE